MAASLPILVGGTVAIDNIKTPMIKHSGLLGGSAIYAALAASFFARPIHLVGIIGNDFPDSHLDMLRSNGIVLDALERSDGRSFTWTGEYYNSMNDRKTLGMSLEVLDNWSVRVTGEAANCPIVVCAAMSPRNQLELLERNKMSRRFVLVDTMDVWIEKANIELHELLRKADLLLINESESRLLAGAENLVKVGRILREKGPRYVVIKLGEFGAILFGPPGCHHGLFRCGAFPLENVRDPTGAGDIFLGGLAGYLASLRKTAFTFEELRDGIVRASVIASYGCEDFSTWRLEKLSESELLKRLEAFRKMSCW